jgi:hypothetical protein
VLLPKRPVAAARRLDIGEPLSDQLLGAAGVKGDPSLDRQVEVPIVGRVAEHARRDDVAEVVALGVALGEQVVPGEAEPVGERLPPVKAAVAVAEVVPPVDGEGISPQRVGECDHALMMPAGCPSRLRLGRVAPRYMSNPASPGSWRTTCRSGSSLPLVSMLLMRASAAQTISGLPDTDGVRALGSDPLR